MAISSDYSNALELLKAVIHHYYLFSVIWRFFRQKKTRLFSSNTLTTEHYNTYNELNEKNHDFFMQEIQLRSGDMIG